MTAFQKFMLDYLPFDGSATRIGSIWVWREDVRRDPSLAERLYWIVAK